MDRSRKLVGIGLLMVIMFGVGIRLIPILGTGATTLADLDPYRNLRAVNSILDSGRIPTFDPLSAAPNATYNTYATSQGYYVLGVALTLISGLDSVQMLAISPVICEVALLLTIYVFGCVLTKHCGAGLVAAFFTTMMQGWAIDMIGTNPLAENFGAVIFPLVLFLFWKYVVHKKIVFLFFSGVILGTALLIHPIIYFYLSITLFTYSIMLCILEKKMGGIMSFLKVILISSFAILIQFCSLMDFGSTINFTHGAMWLTSLQPAHYFIDFNRLVLETGISTLFLGLLGIMLTLLLRKCDYLIVVTWGTIMFAIIVLSLIAPMRSLLASLPFGGFIIFSHRVMAYLSSALSLLSGIVIVDYLLPLVSYITKSINLHSSTVSGKTALVVVVAIVGISLPSIQSYSVYAINYNTVMHYAPHFVSLFGWIEKNTKAGEIFIVNDINLGELIRAFTKRPVVFTVSYQDLTTQDLEKRMWLQSSVFIRGYDDKIAQMLLHDFSVNYIIVVRAVFVTNIDICQKKYTVLPPEDSFSLYIKWIEEKPYLVEVYHDLDGQFYIYSVDHERLFKGEILLPELKP